MGRFHIKISVSGFLGEVGRSGQPWLHTPTSWLFGAELLSPPFRWIWALPMVAIVIMSCCFPDMEAECPFSFIIVLVPLLMGKSKRCLGSIFLLRVGKACAKALRWE